MRWLLPTLITLPLVQGVWDTTPTEARGGCPSVYVYDLPQLWDVRVPLDELRNVSGKFVFGRPCDGGIPEEFDTDQCEIPEQFRRPIVATTAHRHFFLVGKGHVKPNKWCDAWWRAPAGLLRRAMRFAYSSGYAMVPGKNRTGYGPKRLDDDAVAASMAVDAASDDGDYPHLHSVPYASSIHGTHRRGARPGTAPTARRRGS
ncbi:hypothetical protein JL720_2829 [Aureococcus anophagefferens]|nr:hypothetical protein JL720_2829 [Aureococcus anophagefferens]